MRIWSLDPAHKDRPCAAILEGDGHKETVLSLVKDPPGRLIQCFADNYKSFHSSGRYLLSGGIDHMINLVSLRPVAREVIAEITSGFCQSFQISTLAPTSLQEYTTLTSPHRRYMLILSTGSFSYTPIFLGLNLQLA